MTSWQNHRMMQRAGFLLGLFLTAILLAAPGSAAQACNRHGQVSETGVHATAAAKQAASRTAKQNARAVQVLPAKAQTGKTHPCCPCGCSQGLCGGGLAFITSRFDIPSPIAAATRLRPAEGPGSWRIAISAMERPPRA